MKVAVLTSSRADYGIYLPLLKAMKADPFFDLNIIAFGTHLSSAHGETIKQIYSDGFDVKLKIDTVPAGDNPEDIATSMGKTLISFSKVWATNTYDLVFALGDRYEMFAACAGVLPFGIPIAHLHGGETTFGAIDDAFRHSITHMSTYHFTAAEPYKKRVTELKAFDKCVYNVGALGMDNLHFTQMLTVEEFKSKFKIDLSVPSILITFHPETVGFEKNEGYVNELTEALKELKQYQMVITMPNSDTMGNAVRKKLKKFIAESQNAIAVESFGTLGYLSCMKHCSMMLGNTSSGFLEAGFFPKFVINLGERQNGRIVTENIQNCKIKKEEIIKAVNDLKNKKLPSKINIYGEGNTAAKIVSQLKQIYDEKL